MLARDVKRLAAGNQHGEGRTVGQQVGEIGRDRHDLFEVVDHQQEVAAGKVGQQTVSGRLLAQTDQPERLGQCR